MLPRWKQRPLEALNHVYVWLVVLVLFAQHWMLAKNSSLVRGLTLRFKHNDSAYTVWFIWRAWTWSGSLLRSSWDHIVSLPSSHFLRPRTPKVSSSPSSHRVRGILITYGDKRPPYYRWEHFRSFRVRRLPSAAASVSSNIRVSN